ncbi:MAG: SDR family oxidoreductase [Chitinophagaceae bacterium]
MKILVTGANGLIGQHLVYSLSRSHQVIATGKGSSRLDLARGTEYIEMDFTNDAQVQAVFSRERPELVIHSGAITQIDDCEQNQDACFLTNVQGTAQLLLAAEEFSRKFIFLSTDFVFDGEKGNYREDDQLNPVNWYGFTKIQAESTVETSEIPWAIVRTCLVYGNSISGTRSNILTWAKKNLDEGNPVKVVSDQVRTPTYVDDLVMGIGLIIEKDATGIFHISGEEFLTPYDMVMAMAEKGQLDQSLITKVNASTFSQPAKRPLKTGFSIERAKNLLGFTPGKFENNLRKMFEGHP